jgi:hypothetical protein
MAGTAPGASAARVADFIDRFGAIGDGGVDILGGRCVAKADVHR